MIYEDPKKRFSVRVADYKKYRPDYPAGVISFIREHCSPDNTWSVADIGSGTGISTKLLLDGLKCDVFAVEPNDSMMETAIENLSANPLFHSINGSSENSTLANESINLVTAFQSFHWFDREKTRAEFLKILIEPKWVLLVWNDRITDEPGFSEGYEKLLMSLPEYNTVNHKNITRDIINSFMGNTDILTKSLVNSQEFDWTGLKGRFSSSSYTPEPGTAGYFENIAILKKLFDKYNMDGKVQFKYNTEMFLGRMK